MTPATHSSGCVRIDSLDLLRERCVRLASIHEPYGTILRSLPASRSARNLAASASAIRG